MEPIKYNDYGQPLTGVVESYYPDGTLEESIPYRGGYITGWYERRYPDGSLHQLIHYQEGRIDGACWLFYDTFCVCSRYERDLLQDYVELSPVNIF